MIGSDILNFVKNEFNLTMKNVVMIVGNKIKNDSRVIKSATMLKDNNFNVIIFGIDRINEDYKFFKENNLSVILINDQKLSPQNSVEQHFEKTSLIADVINYCLSDVNIDFLYSHDFIALDLSSKIILKQYFKQKIFWIHDVHEYIKGYKNVIPENRYQYALEVERRNISIPDQLIVVNEIISNLLISDYDLFFNKNLILHNVPRKQTQNSFNIKEKLSIPDEHIVGVYLGRATALRGLEIIVDSLAIYENLHYVLFSESDKNYLENLKLKAYKNNVLERLHILDYLPDCEIINTIKICDFGISPLLKYGNSDLALPTKIFDYIHAKLPILCSNTEYQKEFIKLNKLGEVFDSDNQQSYNVNLKSLLNNIDKYKKGNFEEIISKYSWEVQYEQIISLLNDKSYYLTFPNRGVFNGPGSSAGQPGALAKNLRKIGINSQSINISLPAKLGHESDIIWPALSYLEMASFTLWAIDRFEIFHLHFRPLIYSIIDKTTINRKESFFFPTFQDLSLIKHFNKKLIFQFRGSEIRLNSKFLELNPYAWIEKDDPSGFPDKMKIILKNIVEEYADLVLVTDQELQTYVPNAKILERSIEIDKFPYIGCKNKEKPLVLHAPTRRGVKGSEDVIQVLDNLKKKGLDFDFELIENLEHCQLMDKLKSADIIIDQIRIGWYGVLSVEAMAFGKTVFAYIREDIYDSSIPIVNVNKYTLEEKLTIYINDFNLRETTGKRSRKYVERYHSSDNVATKAKMYYELAEKKVLNTTHAFKFNILDAINKHDNNLILTKLKKENSILKTNNSKLKNTIKINNTKNLVVKRKLNVFQKTSNFLVKQILKVFINKNKYEKLISNPNGFFNDSKKGMTKLIKRFYFY